MLKFFNILLVFILINFSSCLNKREKSRINTNNIINYSNDIDDNIICGDFTLYKKIKVDTTNAQYQRLKIVVNGQYVRELKKASVTFYIPSDTNLVKIYVEDFANKTHFNSDCSDVKVVNESKPTVFESISGKVKINLIIKEKQYWEIELNDVILYNNKSQKKILIKNQSINFIYTLNISG